MLYQHLRNAIFVKRCYLFIEFYFPVMESEGFVCEFDILYYNVNGDVRDL